MYFLPKEFYIPFGLGYLAGTFFLSPDLDLKHSKPSKRWKFLKIVWYPYQKKSKHRGISHLPIFGTFIKLLYILIVLTILYYLIYLVAFLYWKEGLETLSKVSPLFLIEGLAQKESAFYMLLGVLASEIMHIIADVLWSVWRKIKP